MCEECSFEMFDDQFMIQCISKYIFYLLLTMELSLSGLGVSLCGYPILQNIIETEDIWSAQPRLVLIQFGGLYTPFWYQPVC